MPHSSRWTETLRIVNLARRPFVNTRPVLRVTFLIGVLGLGLLLTNIWLYQGFWRSSAESRRALSELNQQLNAEQNALRQLDSALGQLDLGEQNEQITYLNRLIAYRTFPWSELFDRLAGVLPDDVRLTSLQPELVPEGKLRAERRRREALARQRQNQARAAARRGAEPQPTRSEKPRTDALAEDEVLLRIAGAAKTDEVLALFVDALFADPAFREPILDQETWDENSNVLTFTLAVIYRPGMAPVTPPADAAGLYASATPAGEATAESQVAAGGPAAGAGGPFTGGLTPPSSTVPPSAATQGAAGQGVPGHQRPPQAGASEPVVGSILPPGRVPAARDPNFGRPADRFFSDRTPSGGRALPPSAGTPSAGTPLGGTPLGGTPLGGTPSGGTPSGRATGDPSGFLFGQPGGQPRATPPQQPGGQPLATPPPSGGLRPSPPSFVNPNASSAARLRGGGSGLAWLRGTLRGIVTWMLGEEGTG